jgi:hypothetical protein
MLHDRRQRYGKRPRQLAYRDAISQFELSEQRATRRVSKRGEGAVESGVLILNHMVKYRRVVCKCQPAITLTLPTATGIVDTGSGAFYGPSAPESG